MDDVRENSFSRARCEHGDDGDLLAKEIAQRAGGCTFSVDPQQGIGLFPTFEDAALSEPHRGAFVTGVVCSIEIYEWIRRRKPVCKG
jgi:hypothetical protein